MATKEEKVKPIEKKYFSIVVECQVPATLSFKVLAESPEQALEMINKASPIDFKPKISKRRLLQAKVLYYGYSTIIMTKKF
jgi:hypothetical protein